MRVWPLLLVLLTGPLIGTSTPAQRIPLRDAVIVVRAAPVALDPSDPARTRVGALSYLGGWQLRSDDPGFGGLSALRIDGRRFRMLSDAGAVVTFAAAPPGVAIAVRVAPLPPGCGRSPERRRRDSESLAHDIDTGRWWVGFEWRNALCRTDASLATADRLVRPQAMAMWRRSGGPETMVRLADGRFLVIAERDAQGARVRPALLFDRDPTDPDVKVAALGYRPPVGFSPTDAAQLPDGRLLILNRSFRMRTRFTACLTLVDPRTIRGGATLAGAIVARFEAPVLAENFEGIAVTTEGARIVIWIVSDNNFASWQRTLLLKFALR